MQTRTILFDEGLHKYTDEYGNAYTSVTQLIGKIEPEFNHKYWLIYTCLKETGYRLKPDVINNCIYVNFTKYTIDELYSGKVKLNITTDELNRRWEKIKKDACDKGNAKHSYLEEQVNLFSKTENTDIVECVKVNTNSNVVLSYRKKVINHKQLEESELKFTYPKIYKKLYELIADGYIIYSEIRVYCADSLVAGTIDILAVKGKEFLIVDWKTNKDEMKFEAGYFKKVGGIKTDQWISTNNKLLKPVNHIADCKGMKYTLQLSLYAHIAELWGFICVGLILFHIRDTKEPLAYKIKYLKKEAQLLLDYNKGKIPAQTTLNLKPKDTVKVRQISFLNQL